MTKTIRRINDSSKIKLITSLIVSLFLIGCGGKSNNSTLTKEGYWERAGYGDVLRLDHEGKVIEIYQFTRETCVDVSSSIDSSSEIQTEINASKLSDNKNTLTIEHKDIQAFKINFRRLNKLPESCLDTRLITKATPNNIFKHFWNNFNDYYAFFDKRQVNWAVQHAKFKPQVDENMSDEDLFNLLSSMINPIKDAHITLESQNDLFTPEQPKKFFLEIQKAFSQQNEFDDLNEFGQWAFQSYFSIIDSYLDAKSIKLFNSPSGYMRLKSATINHSIGYIKIDAMDDFVDGSEADNVKAVRTFMDEIMTSLQDMQGIIIDVRFNGGGYDSVAVAIASYFTDEKKRVLSKKVRYWAGETETVYATIKPANESPYLHPVVIIANQDSASAAESFLLTMKSLSQVTLIGENSQGIFSDKLEKTLPNGWNFTLSNEVFYDSEGINYEGVGVPPDEKVAVFSIGDIKASKDKAIERAMQILGL